MKNLKPLLYLSVLFSVGASFAKAQVVDFSVTSPDVAGQTTADYSGAGAYTDGVTSPDWNPISFGGYLSSTLYKDNESLNIFTGDGTSVSPVVNEKGGTSNVTLSFSSVSSGIALDDAYLDNSPSASAVNYFLGTYDVAIHNASSYPNSAIDGTLSGVSAGTYDLYLYSGDDGGGSTPDDTTFTASTSLTSPTSATTDPTQNTSLVEGNNYVVLPVTVGSNGTIDFSFTAAAGSATGNSDFSGLQLVSVVPEPSTCALLGLAGALLLALRLRRTIKL